MNLFNVAQLITDASVARKSSTITDADKQPLQLIFQHTAPWYFRYDAEKNTKSLSSPKKTAQCARTSFTLKLWRGKNNRNTDENTAIQKNDFKNKRGNSEHSGIETKNENEFNRIQWKFRNENITVDDAAAACI